jgi:histidine triad (HIT) family protein
MFNHAPDDYVCPFCLLVQGVEDEQVASVETDTFCHDEAVTAFIGSHQWPNNPGSAIIIPNWHYENIYDLPVRLGARIHEVAKAVAVAMKKVYPCDGISTRQHNEPAGSQDVWHYHLHVFPRYRNDRLYLTQRRLMVVEERARYARRLESYFRTSSNWRPKSASS